MIRMLVAGAVSAVAFGVMAGVPRRCLPGVGLAGVLAALGLVVVADLLRGPGVLAAGLGAFLMTLGAEALARLQRVTAVAYLVPGVVPLVPGVAIYRAMLAFVQGRYALGGQEAVLAVLWAGAVAFGIVLAATLVRARRMF